MTEDEITSLMKAKVEEGVIAESPEQIFHLNGNEITALYVYMQKNPHYLYTIRYVNNSVGAKMFVSKTEWKGKTLVMADELDLTDYMSW